MVGASAAELAGGLAGSSSASSRGEIAAGARHLEVDDPSIGAQTQKTGYALVGASYDSHDARVEPMFGLPRGDAPHLTRSIAHVDSVAVQSAPTGEDLGLRITHGEGQTILTFQSEA
jgi:hypothetical protein